MTHTVVLKLLEGLENRGHHVYMDNYYSSPSLFQNLRRLGFDACGTVRTNRRGVPEEIKAKLQKGEIVSKMIDNDVLALKWMDKRPVAMLTTVHDDSVVTKQRRTRAAQGGVEEVHKPLVVERYNEFMGGVDMGDQLLSYYGFSHRTLKWWRRAFIHLIEVAIVNAYIMYLTTPCEGRRLTHKELRIQLAKELLMDTVDGESHCCGPHPNPNPPSFRLTGRHSQQSWVSLLRDGHHSQTALSAVGRRAMDGSLLPTNANSVISPCVWYHALSSTTQKPTQNATSNIFMNYMLRLSL